MSDEQSRVGDWTDEGSGGTRRSPDRCLSFTVSGPWGHFRRVEGNIVKQTYRVIPRTTVAGLVAAMLGIGRDEYYDLFAPDTSAVAIEPVEDIRTMNMPMNTLSTAKESMKTLNSRGSLSISFPDSTENRQQHNYEVLVEPRYRIDLWLDNDKTYARLRETLEEGRSHYVPSLGLSEYLAEVEYHGEFKVNEGTSGEVVEVSSTVPSDSIIPDAGTEFRMEKPPAYMEADSGGRRTTAFVSYSYSPDAEPLTVQAKEVETKEVDGRQVVFV
jgi:CRISPR-associated protein Cas5h